MIWGDIFKDIEPRLAELTKDSSDGLIHINQLEEIIEDTVGIDGRTKKKIINILLRREILIRASHKTFVYCQFFFAHPEMYKKEKNPKNSEGDKR